MNESMPRNEGGESGTKSQVRETASKLARGMKEQARSQYDERKNVAVGELGTLAAQLRTVVDELGTSHPGNVSGRVVSTLADRIEAFGQTLEGKDLDTILSDVERFARRNPAAFLGGAVAIGFLAARFLKSSAIGMRDESYNSAGLSSSDEMGGTDWPIGSNGYSGGAVPTSGFSPGGSQGSGRTSSGFTSEMSSASASANRRPGRSGERDSPAEGSNDLDSNLSGGKNEL